MAGTDVLELLHALGPAADEMGSAARPTFSMGVGGDSSAVMGRLASATFARTNQGAGGAPLEGHEGQQR